MDVRRHDSAAEHAATIEQAARRIARALGCEHAWAVPVNEDHDPAPEQAAPTARGESTRGLLNDTAEERGELHANYLRAKMRAFETGFILFRWGAFVSAQQPADPSRSSRLSCRAAYHSNDLAP